MPDFEIRIPFMTPERHFLVFGMLVDRLPALGEIVPLKDPRFPSLSVGEHARLALSRMAAITLIGPPALVLKLGGTERLKAVMDDEGYELVSDSDMALEVN